VERRWSRRKQVGQDVLLHYDGQQAAVCTIRDLSFEGARIDTGSLVVAPSVEVQLHFCGSGDQGMVRIGATVVRVLEDGIGVNFSEYHDGSCRYLLTLLD